MDGFLRVACRLGDVEAVAQGHLPQFAERHDLARQLFAQTDRFFLDDIQAQFVFLRFLVLDQEIQTVQGDATVIADDTAAAVSIRQAGDDARTAGAQHVVGVGIEHALVVGAAILAEDTLNLRVDLVAVLFQRLRRHADAAERHHCALQGLVRLQADDLFQLLVDVAGSMRGDVADDMRVGVNHAALVEFLLVQIQNLIPDIQRALGGRCQEGLIAEIRREVAVNEVADVDFLGPVTGFETFPGVFTHRSGIGSGHLVGYRDDFCFACRFGAFSHCFISPLLQKIFSRDGSFDDSCLGQSLC